MSTSEVFSESPILIYQAPEIASVIGAYFDYVKNKSEFARVLRFKIFSELSLIFRNYEVNDPSLLSLKKNEVVKILNRRDDGWLVGELRGKVGMVKAT